MNTGKQARKRIRWILVVFTMCILYLCGCGKSGDTTSGNDQNAGGGGSQSVNGKTDVSGNSTSGTGKNDSSDTEKSIFYDFSNVKQGDIIKFGFYEQDNNLGNGKEPIEWIVLSAEDGELFVTSKYVLDKKKYNEEQAEVNWFTCSLKKWLNEDFYNTAFDAVEQSMLKTMIGHSYSESGSVNSDEMSYKVFLLTYYDVLNMDYGFNWQYDTCDIKRRCAPTAYAIAQGVSVMDGNDPEYKTASGENTCAYWLYDNDIDYYSHSGSACNVNGKVYSGGVYVDNEEIAVRPALRIIVENLKSDLDEKISSGEISSETYDRIDFSSVNPGDTILFGTYEQDNNLNNGKEPIEWKVLSKNEDEILLVSCYSLDYRRFNEDGGLYSWKNSSLRKWLNRKFYNEAFTESEKAQIKLTSLSNDTLDGEVTQDTETEDKVFLLSVEDITNVDYGFKTGKKSEDDNRKCTPTEYAKANGAHESDEWWLRSIGEYPGYVAVLNNRGYVSTPGGGIHELKAIRPAIIIHVK